MTNYSPKGKAFADILDALNMTQNEFAARTTVSQSHVSRVISNEKNVSAGMLEKMILVFPNVNLNRIFTGEGPILFPQSYVSELREPDAKYGVLSRCEHLQRIRQTLLQSLTVINDIIAEDCQK